MIRINVLVIMAIGGLLAYPLDTGASGDWDEALSVHGFVSQGFLLSDTNDVYGDTRQGSFQFNEFGLTISAQLSERLHVGMQTLSRDLGTVGNNAVKLDWAFADYRWRDRLGFRAGVLKIPWGIYNETRDIDLLRTHIFLPSSLYDEELRDIYDSMEGIALYGSLPLGKFGTLNYQTQYGDKSLPVDLFDPIVFPEATITTEAFEVRNIYMGTIEWETPLDGLRLRQTTGEYDLWIKEKLALSPQIGGDVRFEEGEGRQTFAISSVDYSAERLALALEWQQVWNAGEASMAEDNAAEGGWYVGAAYRLTDWLEIGAYYSVFYADWDDQDGRNYSELGAPAYLAWQKDAALTTRFDIGEHFTIKLEGHAIDGTAQLSWDGPEWPDRETLLLAAKMTFNF